MRAVIQRVLSAQVTEREVTVGKIEQGLLVYVGVTHDDSPKKAESLIKKIVKLRIFEDDNGKLNKSVADIGGNIMLISNFTLYGNALAGNRPDFFAAAGFTFAKEMYDFCKETLIQLMPTAQFGVFGGDMRIDSVADGPVNIIIEV